MVLCESLTHKPDKTNILFLGTRQMLNRLPQNLSMSFLGATLKPVASAKDLEVFQDPHLTYDHHQKQSLPAFLSYIK